MQGLILSIIAGLLRYGLAGASAWLIRNGIVTAEQVEQLIVGIAAGLFAIGLLIWTKVQQRRELATALAARPGTTIAEVREQVRAGEMAPARTPDHVSPRITHLGR